MAMEYLTEQDVATALGVTVKDLNDLRAAHLEKDTHWVRSHRRFLYKNSALKTLAEVLASATNAPTEAASFVPEVTEEVLAELIVWRTAQHGVRNWRVLEAHEPKKDPRSDATAPILRVKVSDNRTFLRGMSIVARQIEGDLWEHWDPVRKAAAPSPRARGRW